MMRPSTTRRLHATRRSRMGDSHEEWERRLAIPDAVRRAVFERDEYACQLCGVDGENRLQLHHVTLRSHGGRHTNENLVVVCFRCHDGIHAGRLGITLAEVRPGLIRAFPCTPTRYRS